MARVLDVLPGRHINGNTKYPWPLWFDGRVWDLRRGEDYDCKHGSFRMRASDMAWKCGGRVAFRSVKNDDGEQLGWVIQFVPIDDPTTSAAA